MVMTDKGYDSDAFRKRLANRGTLSALRRAGIERPRPLLARPAIASATSGEFANTLLKRLGFAFALLS